MSPETLQFQKNSRGDTWTPIRERRLVPIMASCSSSEHQQHRTDTGYPYGFYFLRSLYLQYHCLFYGEVGYYRYSLPRLHKVMLLGPNWCPSLKLRFQW